MSKKINNYELYTIGDYVNDINMLENSKISFAPNNAHPIVKNKVNYIVRDNNNNAIYDMINLLDLYLGGK